MVGMDMEDKGEDLEVEDLEGVDLEGEDLEVEDLEVEDLEAVMDLEVDEYLLHKNYLFKSD